MSKRSCLIRSFSLPIFCGLLFGYATSIQASGFALIEQSASGQGLSYAGAAASTEDASVMWFNPAGLAHIKGNQVIGAVHLIQGKAPFTNDGSYVVSTGDPLYGEGDDGATKATVPNAYWKTEMGQYHFGLGVNVPFGSTVSYDQNWVGRYHAVYTKTQTVNINPAVARQFGNCWSFGGGLNAQYINVNLTQKIDLAGFGASQSNDGYADLKADNWAYGYNFGAIYAFENKAKLGIAYRSKVSHSATGKADFTVQNIPASLESSFQDTDITASVDLPDSLSISYVTPITDSITLLADATWTGWSSFQELRIKYKNPARDDTVQPEEWKDVMRYALGATYQASDQWVWRTGVAYDETPIKTKQLRTPRIVDSNRIWISAGVGYRILKNLNLDVGYTHIYGGKPKLEATDADSKDHVLNGHFDININILSAQLVWSY